ncbi:MAG: RIP metalloprotease RseP [Betaproteobacteria bacterium]
MSNFSLYLVAFAIVLGVLVLVHELGHYAVARLCGVKVLRFSVGFGKALWSKRFKPGGTEWAIGAFPLGGYVKMLDEREAEVSPQELEYAYNRKSIGRRSAIVAAGPAANFILAILLYWGLFWVGSEELLPILGNPPASSPAAIAGIVNGERVVAVDGQSVDTWQDFRWLILKKAAEQESVEISVANERNELAFRRLPLAEVSADGWQGDGLERLGLTFFRPHIPAVLGEIVPGSAAERSGLKSGDELLAIAGVPVTTWQDVVLKVRASPGIVLAIDVVRGAERLTFNVQPDKVEDRGKRIGRMGAAPRDMGEARRETHALIRYDFFTAGSKALSETWEKSAFSLVMLGKMLTGEVSWRNLSGPVTIADYAGQSAKLGIDYYLKFMALVSVSLGVLNLLPIPVLDGGHLLYHMLEVIKRGPLSDRFMEIGQQIGLAILLALMAFAFFNDINRLLSG